MNSSDIRLKLNFFLGDEDYRKFVLSLYNEVPFTKFLFWQERLLTKFKEVSEVRIVNEEHAISVFNHCPIHDVFLQKDNVKILNWTNLKIKESNALSMSLFPLSNMYAPRRLDLYDYPEAIEVFYCEECRKEERKIS